jgi:hypothetical protein
MCEWLRQILERKADTTDLSELKVGHFVAYVDILGFKSVTTDPLDIPAACHMILDLNRGIDLLCQLPRFRSVRAFGFSDCAFIVFDTFEAGVLFCSTLFQICMGSKARLRGAITMGYAYDLRPHTDKQFRAKNFRPSPFCGTAFTLSATLESQIKLPGVRLYYWACNSTPGSGVTQITRDTGRQFPGANSHPVTVREVVWPSNYNANVVTELNQVAGTFCVPSYQELRAKVDQEKAKFQNLAACNKVKQGSDATFELFEYWEQTLRPNGLPPAP